MNKHLVAYFFCFALLICGSAFTQDPVKVFQWAVKSKKISANTYELSFLTAGNKEWQLYEPNQILSGVPTTEIQFADTVIHAVPVFKDSGKIKVIQSALFNAPVKIHEGPSGFKVTVSIKGKVPATLQGTLLYTYGRNDEFYPSTS